MLLKALAREREKERDEPKSPEPARSADTMTAVPTICHTLFDWLSGSFTVRLWRAKGLVISVDSFIAIKAVLPESCALPL